MEGVARAAKVRGRACHVAPRAVWWGAHSARNCSSELDLSSSTVTPPMRSSAVTVHSARSCTVPRVLSVASRSRLELTPALSSKTPAAARLIVAEPSRSSAAEPKSRSKTESSSKPMAVFVPVHSKVCSLHTGLSVFLTTADLCTAPFIVVSLTYGSEVPPLSAASRLEAERSCTRSVP